VPGVWAISKDFAFSIRPRTPSTSAAAVTTNLAAMLAVFGAPACWSAVTASINLLAFKVRVPGILLCWRWACSDNNLEDIPWSKALLSLGRAEEVAAGGPGAGAPVLRWAPHWARVLSIVQAGHPPGTAGSLITALLVMVACWAFRACRAACFPPACPWARS